MPACYKVVKRNKNVFWGATEFSIKVKIAHETFTAANIHLQSIWTNNSGRIYN